MVSKGWGRWLGVIAATALFSAEPVSPIPSYVPHDVKKAALGKHLFFDPRLSADGSISCATCHQLQAGGDDGLRVSVGIEGKRGNINAPTVLNAVFNFRQFWDGRAKDLKEQAAGPIENPVEMGASFPKLIQRLEAVPEYRRRFAEIYPQEGITKNTVTDAIAEYEKTLITPDSPFDRYLKGDKKAIDSRARRGYMLFKVKGCISCHNGVNIGGNLYNKFGIYEDVNSTHPGRYRLTGREEDKGVFKVPSLRNVALTAPYMHDGRLSRLEDAVKFMAHFQLGKTLTQEEVDAIVAFLKSLSGKLPRKAVAVP